MASDDNFTVITNGAYFRARVFHIAYKQAAEILNVPWHSDDWDSLSAEDRKHIALAFQLMMDMDLIEPLTLHQVMLLRTHNWIKPR